jgi:small subunit ribosomal protein S4
LFKDISEALEDRMVPEWLSVDKTDMKFNVVRVPERSEIDIPVEEHLIVERYSR